MLKYNIYCGFGRNHNWVQNHNKILLKKALGRLFLSEFDVEIQYFIMVLVKITNRPKPQ